MSTEARQAPAAVIWHDVECGGYPTDLGLWERLAAEHPGPVLELGCGTGRVALHLAARGHEVVGVDFDQDLVQAARARAAARDLPVRLYAADVRELDLGESFPLVLAPMQLPQLLGGTEERARALKAARRHLDADGVLAAAIVEGEPEARLGIDVGIVPDVREEDGWIYSSLPLEVIAEPDRLIVRRLRQTVAPDGRLTEELYADVLDILSANDLEAEAQTAGLSPAGRLAIEETDLHIGSTVVLLRREGAP